MGNRPGCVALAVLLAAAGCGAGDDDDRPPGASASPSPSPEAGLGTAVQPGLTAGSSATPSTRRTRTRAARRSGGWTVTVYYTAVQRFHGGRPTAVRGCRTINCTGGDADLGTFPADFVDTVREEGTGRTAAGRYLNWSHDVGFWLDDAPRDARGRPLRPWRSAAADADVLPAGTEFTIVDCGRDDDGGRIAATVCRRMRAARWLVTDEFTPGLGGDSHVDVYIGEETGPDFTDTAWYTTLNGATLAIA
jgi:hypothetical protein